MLVEEGRILALKTSAALYSGSGSSSKFYIFDTDSGRQFSLNETGFFAFSQFDGKKTFGEIVDLCQNRYNVTREILLQDLSIFLVKALETGLVTGN